MKKVILESGTYAADDALEGFDIIEKPSSNVAFVATCMITNQMYVQFKNGSGYMYSEVDLDTLSAVTAVDSIGKFISSQVVKKFPSEKMEKALIIYDGPLLILTGAISAMPNHRGHVFIMDEEATVEYVEPSTHNEEPTF
jgi:hypothetical protein